jgi:hypothetical protein
MSGQPGTAVVRRARGRMNESRTSRAHRHYGDDGRHPRTALDDLSAVADLLRALHEEGQDEQVATLAARAATYTPIHWLNAGVLMTALREVGAGPQLRELMSRLPAEGEFYLFRMQTGPGTYTFGREPDEGGNPAPSWSWKDLD